MTRMKNRVILAALVVSFAAAASAQVAMIRGKLEDGTGKPIAGYPVILEKADGATGYGGNIGFTSETGEFAVTVDQPGEYSAILPTLNSRAPSSFQVPPEALQPDMLKAPTTDIGTIYLQR